MYVNEIDHRNIYTTTSSVCYTAPAIASVMNSLPKTQAHSLPVVGLCFFVGSCVISWNVGVTVWDHRDDPGDFHVFRTMF